MNVVSSHFFFPKPQLFNIQDQLLANRSKLWASEENYLTPGSKLPSCLAHLRETWTTWKPWTYFQFAELYSPSSRAKLVER